MKNILGISAFYHDAAAAIIQNGKIIAAAQEERFTRVKHTSAFPQHSIAYCLEEAGISIDELDTVVFYDKPFLTFERLLETYYAFSPAGIRSFLRAIPIWLEEKLFLKKKIRDGLKEVESYNRKKLNLLFSEHHLSHAASAYFTSNFDEAAILTIDGVGEWATASISVGKGNEISLLKEMHFPHSIGLLYSAFTYFLGFKVNSGEYKLMGLAPYGTIESEECKYFVKTIKQELLSIKQDGSIWINQQYFDYATGLKMINEKAWQRLFGMNRRDKEEKLTQTHCNLAAAIQLVLEEVVLKMAKEVHQLTGISKLCMAGGVALNCTANGKLLESDMFEEIYVQPAASDAGAALGAALAIHHIYYKEEKKESGDFDQMHGTYLGPYFSNKEIIQTAKRQKAVFEQIESFDALSKRTAKELAEGAVIGWFQGRMEFGPRALGNRSILADPRKAEMQKKLNLKIKQREGFRPFAPAVLAEDATKYFDLKQDSPYMLFIYALASDQHLALPENYNQLDFWDKLYTKRSQLPVVTHVNYSARVQTVKQKTNEKFWKLLNEFKSLTGCSVLVNTSFNVRGEPIVCSPEDAYACFMNTDMDYLVMNNFWFKKEDQPNYQDQAFWKKRFELD